MPEKTPWTQAQHNRFARRITIGYLILSLGTGLAFYQDHQADMEREKERIARVHILNDLNRSQCLEIETLKRKERDDAQENYDRLDETLALLKLERTPALEARALSDLNDALKDFEAQSCPREPIPLN